MNSGAQPPEEPSEDSGSRRSRGDATVKLDGTAGTGCAGGRWRSVGEPAVAA
jgi:hypothetical protein